MENQKSKLEDWKNRQVRVIVFYQSPDKKSRKVIGKIIDLDDIFIFIKDEVYIKECCVALKDINMIELYKEELKDDN